MLSPIEAIAVGIPARDESALIEACLGSVVRAARRVDVPVHIVVAADDCTDDTSARARRVLDAARSNGLSGTVIETAHRSAAAARSAAVETALLRWGDAVEHVWVATTDADTVVGEGWLAAHLDWARAGFDGVAGLVGVAWQDDDHDLAARYLTSIALGGTAEGHHHVHGANLGFRAARWRAVGGCGSEGDGEDHRLWHRLRAHGAQLLGVIDLEVTTSARLEGRAGDGFAGYLGRLAARGA